MPIVSLIDGTTLWVPQVQTVSTIESSLSGPTPTFLVPIIVAGAYEGHHWDAAADQGTSETLLRSARLTITDSDTAAYYGWGSDIHVAMRYAKLHGLPRAYTIAVNDLARGNVVVTSAGPVNEINLYPLKWGAAAMWTKIQFTIAATNVISIFPIKHFTLLSANASLTSTRIQLKGWKATSWLRVGMSIDIGHNTATEVETLTIADFGSELDANGQITYWAELSAAPAVAYATASFAMIVEYLDLATATEFAAVTDSQGLLDWINANSQYLGASETANFTGTVPIAQPVAVRMLEAGAIWGAVTPGESPDAVTGDFNGLIPFLDASEWDAFLVTEGIVPYIFLICDSDFDVHGNWRNWAIARRVAGTPVQIYTGMAYTDVAVATITARAQAMNSQELYLCAGRMDRLHPYLSLAGAVFGRKVAGGVGHNITQDDLIYENILLPWNETTSGELTTLHRLGVITYRMVPRKGRYVISQDINTHQNRETIWDTQNNASGYGVPRVRMDFVNATLQTLAENTQLGADRVDPESVAAVLLTQGNKLLFPAHLKVPLTIRSTAIGPTGTEIITAPEVTLLDLVDFIQLDIRTIVGE